jgi:VIT1/CCC1 family predicted Fe2+/Mn2+ transporter
VREPHRTERIGWLRASVLGANDGIISIASLMVGVAAAGSPSGDVIIAGIAGLVSGALSMAAGEYVSVSSQADTERAELTREQRELTENPDGELDELATIYIRRGLNAELAHQVARQLTSTDALGAHVRDELGLSEALTARPIQAAVASAISFAAGAALPLGVAVIARADIGSAAITIASLFALFGLGALSAVVGGAPAFRAAIRVTFWGALAMALTAGVGWLFSVSV